MHVQYFKLTFLPSPLSLPSSLSGTCCISDLSHAIKSDSNLELELRNRPQTDYRYMAPELLADLSTQNSFESLKKVDIYSYGLALVLWEIARRCTVPGKR